jgi:hypothetical protein
MIAYSVAKNPSLLKAKPWTQLVIQHGNQKMEVASEELNRIYHEYSMLISFLHATETMSTTSRAEFMRLPHKYVDAIKLLGFDPWSRQQECLVTIFGAK